MLDHDIWPVAPEAAPDADPELLLPDNGRRRRVRYDTAPPTTTVALVPTTPVTRDNWVWAYAGLAAVAAALSFVLIRFTLDDSFITWRYGQTFVHTGHWNWNATGPRVEAYTNPLYAFASIVPAFLRIPSELFFKLVSLALLGGYVAVVRRLQLPRRQELVLLAVVVASPVFLLQLFGGLETASFALLLALLFGAIYRNGRLDSWGYAVALALALSRPEGILFAAAALGWALLIRRDRVQIISTCVVLFSWGDYWLWRWQHFGWFFPNTFYKKAGNGSGLTHRLIDVAGSLAPIVALTVAGVLIAVLFYQRSASAPEPRAVRLQRGTPLVLAALSSVVVLGLYKQSVLVMDPGHRFFWQLLFPVVLVVLCKPIGSGADLPALLAVFVATATAIAWAPLNAGDDLVLIVAALLVLAATAAGIALQLRGASAIAALGLAVGIGYMSLSQSMGWAVYRYRLEAAHQALGKVIASTHAKGGVAISDAGVLPFEIPNEVIDLDGLANAGVTHGKVSFADFDRAHLDLIFFLSTNTNLNSALHNTYPTALAWQYALSRGYWSSTGAMFSPGYYLNYLMNPKLAETGLPARLAKVADASQVSAAKSDTDLFLANLWNFPFFR